MARILVIDDDEELLDIYRIVLESHAHTVETVAAGDRAVEATCRFHPDLIVLDWMMPGMSGDVVFNRLRNSSARCTPVLMVSALDGANAASRLVGADGFLAKPFEVDELELAITELLAGKSSARPRAPSDDGVATRTVRPIP